MIRRCTDSDVPVIESIINQAAQAYEGVIPSDCFHHPYMTEHELLQEIAAGVQFWASEEEGTVIGVMGVQNLRDVTLIRHAYVANAHQKRGIGGALLNALVQQAKEQLLVGTWAAAVWAIRFYERHGFCLVSAEEKDRLLSTYWTISQRQRETSVVLKYAGARA